MPQNWKALDLYTNFLEYVQFFTRPLAITALLPIRFELKHFFFPRLFKFLQVFFCLANQKWKI